MRGKTSLIGKLSGALKEMKRFGEIPAPACDPAGVAGSHYRAKVTGR
jgi:hypothetical protein